MKSNEIQLQYPGFLQSLSMFVHQCYSIDLCRSFIRQVRRLNPLSSHIQHCCSYIVIIPLSQSHWCLPGFYTFSNISVKSMIGTNNSQIIKSYQTLQTSIKINWWGKTVKNTHTNATQNILWCTFWLCVQRRKKFSAKCV